MASHHNQYPTEPPCAPKFLGHLTENDRIIGFLLQKVEGGPAGVDDLANCEALLRRLHRLELIHGDVNQNNFIVDRVSGSNMRLIDFEHVEPFDEGLARAELLSLPVELAEETGRGATV